MLLSERSDPDPKFSAKSDSEKLCCFRSTTLLKIYFVIPYRKVSYEPTTSDVVWVFKYTYCPSSRFFFYSNCPHVTKKIRCFFHLHIYPSKFSFLSSLSLISHLPSSRCFIVLSLPLVYPLPQPLLIIPPGAASVCEISGLAFKFLPSLRYIAAARPWRLGLGQVLVTWPRRNDNNIEYQCGAKWHYEGIIIGLVVAFNPSVVLRPARPYSPILCRVIIVPCALLKKPGRFGTDLRCQKQSAGWV